MSRVPPKTISQVMGGEYSLQHSLKPYTPNIKAPNMITSHVRGCHLKVMLSI